MPGKNDVEAIKKFLDTLWGQAQGMLAKGARKTEVAAHVAKTKVDLYMIAGRKEDLFLKLGEAFYASSKRKKASAGRNQCILAVMRELAELDQHEKGLKRELKKGAVKVPKVRKATTSPTGKRRGRPPKKRLAVKKANAE